MVAGDVFHRAELTFFVATVVISLIFMASNIDAFQPSFDSYCLLVGLKGMMLSIESASFALVGRKYVCCHG